MTSTFTFVNTVDAPSLSASSSKAMRAHVTKTNFANRRKRIASEGRRSRGQILTESSVNQSVTLVEDEPQRQRHIEVQAKFSDSAADNVAQVRREKEKRSRIVKPSRTENSSQAVSMNEARTTLTLMRPRDPLLMIAGFMQHFAPVKFPSESSPAGRAGKDLWVTLLFKEPAFYEASLAVGVSYRPVVLQGLRSTPETHAGNAISIVNDRLSDPRRAVSDGVLAAVFTLGVWELRAGHDDIWGVHIDGLAKMIALRNAQGREIPHWFSDLFIYNGFSITSPARKERYQKIIDALMFSGEELGAVNMTLISTYMAQLSRGLDFHRRYGMPPAFVAEEIEEPIKHLHDMAKRLNQGDRPLLHASGLAIIIFLQLSWPKQSDIPLSHLAHELRNVLDMAQFRPCSAIDLAVWKYFIGAVASPPRSDDRRWFVVMLLRLLRAIPVDTWSEVLVVLKRAYLPDVLLLEKVKEVWEECESLRRF